MGNLTRYALSVWVRRALRWLPWLVALGTLALVADVAMAQSTGGSFGGGSFGGGGNSSSGSGYSGGGGGEDGLLELVFYVVFSRLPWPLKIGAVVLIGGIWGGIKLAKKHRKRNDDES